MISIPLKDFPFKEHGIPPPDKAKIGWSANIKKAFLLLINDGIIDKMEFLKAYKVSEEEFSAWEEAFRRSGRAGLYLTKHRR
jgi:hypothetical protein